MALSYSIRFKTTNIRRYLVYFLCGLSLLVFCHFQLKVSRKKKIFIKNYSEGKLELPKAAAWLINWTFSHKIPMFIIQPGILERFIEHPQFNHELKWKTISFGLFGQEENRLIRANLQPAVDNFSKKFKYRKTRESLPRSHNSKNPKKVTTHYLIYNDFTVIDIVIFWQVGTFLWTGGTQDELPLKYGKNLMFGWHGRSYNVFSTKLIYHEGLYFRAPRDIEGFLWQLEASRYMPCNYTRQKIFFKKYPDQRKPKHMESFFKGLVLVTKRLNKKRKRSWLVSGTLLGWFRQCGIHRTTDTDIGVWAREYEPTDLHDLKRKEDGTWVIRRTGKPEDTFQIKMKAEGFKVDIFFVYEERNYTWYGCLAKNDTDKLRTRFPLIPELCSCELYGYRFNIPCNVKDLIVTEYGDEWQTPIGNWNWKWYKSAHNTEVIKGYWPEEEVKDIARDY